MRGQSEVIAALLMTAVVLAGFTIVWIFLYPRYLEWEREAGSTALESRLAASEWLVLGNTVFGSDRLGLTLVNTGSVELRVRAIYVNESLAWQGSLSLAPGQKGEVSAPLPREGRIFWIKVCTARGNCWTFLEVNWTAPAAPPPPPPPPPPAQPLFRITEYNSTIYGLPGGSANLVVEVANIGGSGGGCTVEVYDHQGNLVASSTAYIPVNSSERLTLALPLPNAPGVYLWEVKVLNLLTGAYDDSRSVTVVVSNELIRNGDFSQGSAYWDLESPWYVDTSMQLARIYTSVKGSMSASISQTFEIASAVTLTQLKLDYHMGASRPGQVEILQLVIKIENATATLWTGSINWQTNQNPTNGTYTAPLSLQLNPGTYRLRITAVLVTKQQSVDLDVRVDKVSLLAAAP